MKRSIKIYLIPVAVLSLLFLGSCSDWTDTENLEIKTPSLNEQNPELCKQYLAALRAYKQTDHQITYVTMRNSTATPGQRNEHLTTMPDSVDYICLMTAENLHPVLAGEMPVVRTKGTKITYRINYDEMESRWAAILEEEANGSRQGGEEPEGPTEEERFLEFCKEQTKAQLAYCDKYGFDGIEFLYTGRAPESMQPAEKEQYTVRQQTFFEMATEWYEANKEKLFFFRGYPQNIIDRGFLADCNYIILPAVNAASGSELSYTVIMAIMSDVPTDRFIVAVSTPSLTDPTSDTGYFAGFESDGTRISAIRSAAQWAVIPDPQYKKAGIAVDDAQNDYFNINKVYKNIKEAINIMNPSPKY